MTAAAVRDLIERGRSAWVPRGLTGPTSDELRSLCKDAHWHFVEVRLAGVDDKAELMRTLARQLEFPAYFGGNWDALEECLGDIVAESGGMVLRIKGLGALAPGLSAPLVDILHDLVTGGDAVTVGDVDGGPSSPAPGERARGEAPAPLVVVADPPLPR